MSVNESSATALVRFTGLGILCFNQRQHRGEVGVIRDQKHELSIKIQRPAFQEADGRDLIVYKDIATYAALPKENVQIEIKAHGQGAISGYQIYQSGDFDRLESPDPNDFRWVVNMNALHDDATVSKTKEGRHPLTKIYVSNGLFYAHKLDTNLTFEKVGRDQTGNQTREAFGNVAETVGVKIEGDEVSFAIRIHGKEEIHTLKRIDGLPYRIEIKNMDYNTNAVYSDLPDYYKYVASAKGERYELTPLVETAGGDSVNNKEFCHPIVVDDPPSIDDFGA